MSQPSEKRGPENIFIYIYKTSIFIIVAIKYLSTYIYIHVCVSIHKIHKFIFAMCLYTNCVNLSHLLHIYKSPSLTVRNLIPIMHSQWIHFTSLNIESSFRVVNKDHDQKQAY